MDWASPLMWGRRSKSLLLKIIKRLLGRNEKWEKESLQALGEKEKEE